MKTLCKDTMINSFSRISFYGERRGAQDFEYYTELLENDLKELGESAGNYKEKFIDKVMNIYHRQSNCTSSFIVGPANYNVRRHEKAWNSRDKAYSDFEHWRKKYFKAVNRVRTLSPEAELDKLPEEIDRLTFKRDSMKEFNKELKKKNRDIEKLKGIYSNITSATFNAEDLKHFQSFEITSLTTKIRERNKKIKIMQNRIKAKENQKPVNFKGGVIFIENDRVIIKHDEKPDREIIDEIKKRGFRWSRNFSSWCRKHTANARYDANYLLNNVFGGVIK